MLKFLVSGLSLSTAVVSVSGVEQGHAPAFTLRHPGEFSRHDIHGIDGRFPPPPIVDPKERRPKPAPIINGVMKPRPSSELERLRPGLHPLDNAVRFDIESPPPPHGDPVSSRPKPVAVLRHLFDGHDHHPAVSVDNVEDMGVPRPFSTSKIDLKPKPKPQPKSSKETNNAKPKPKPKPKPAPSGQFNPSRSAQHVDELTSVAQDQCQKDYMLLCTSRGISDYFSGQYGMLTRGNAFEIDVVMIDQLPQRKPCMEKVDNNNDDNDGDDDDDDDYEDDEDYDDDFDNNDNDDNLKFSQKDEIFDHPILALMQSLFPSFPRPTAVPTSIMSSSVPISHRFLKDDNKRMLFIGYGSDGDTCLLDNYERLTPYCQDSIDELQMATDEIDLSDDEGCNLFPFLLILLLTLLIIRCVARRRMAKRMTSVQKTLAAIHASPELKAKVEAASGVPLPPLIPQCRIEQKPWYMKMVCTLGCIAVGFLVVFNSFIITGVVVSGMYDDADSDEGAPFYVVLPILLTMMCVQLFVLRRIREAFCAYLDSRENRTMTASSGTDPSSGGSSGGESGLALPRIFYRMPSVQMSSLFPKFSRPGNTSNSTPPEPQYVPLLSDEERSNTEIVMCASAPPANISSAGTAVIPVVMSTNATSHVSSNITML